MLTAAEWPIAIALPHRLIPDHATMSPTAK
jgi:hypothetical protein